MGYISCKICAIRKNADFSGHLIQNKPDFRMYNAKYNNVWSPVINKRFSLDWNDSCIIQYSIRWRDNDMYDIKLLDVADPIRILLSTNVSSGVIIEANTNSAVWHGMHFFSICWVPLKGSTHDMSYLFVRRICWRYNFTFLYTGYCVRDSSRLQYEKPHILTIA
jgi:hypothetical protein